jgi:glutathione S-transferase
LDGLKDKAVMIPHEAGERIEVLKWEAFADDLTAAAINLYMEKVRHPNDYHKDFTSSLENNIKKAYDHIEDNLPKLKKFNLATIAVASAIGYIHFRLPHLKAQGAVLGWFEEISKRPSMAQTVPMV